MQHIGSCSCFLFVRYIYPLVLTALLAIAATASARTFNVGDMPALRSAVQTSNTLPGRDRIVIAAGFYNLGGSQLLVTDELDIEGPAEFSMV